MLELYRLYESLDRKLVDYLHPYVFVIGLCLNRNKANAAIEKTNKIKLDEIRKKVREEQKKEQ